MVTGGCDRAVRLWTRFITSRPVASLLGHRTAVLDVKIYQAVEQILSYSRDAVSAARCQIFTAKLNDKNNIYRTRKNVSQIYISLQLWQLHFTQNTEGGERILK